MSTTDVPAATTTAPELKIVQDATCTFCGCVCDDIDLKVDVAANRIIEAKRACVLGKAWFFNHHIEDRPEATIEGRPVSYDEALDRAAEILLSANYPVTYGLSDTTSEAQRVAVAITDWIGGTVDTTTSVCHGPSGMAFQGVGEVTCSLGEIRNRADFLIFWG
ncbi:MAG: formylmethanofuran dehydrogenase subunit B, partial [Maioricimonas sp. JB049]